MIETLSKPVETIGEKTGGTGGGEVDWGKKVDVPKLRDGAGGKTSEVHDWSKPIDVGALRENTNTDVARSAMIPRTGGKWSGKEGDSKWVPNDSEVPNDKHGTNPEGKTWKEIKDKYHIKDVPFKDGEPDFSEVSKGNVEIDDFTDDRDSNFSQADEKLAEQKWCTPEEVAAWRKEHKYTWHECGDCKTMQKVPTEVHGNVPHSGGISRKKQEMAA